jgi:hypothetical protein
VQQQQQQHKLLHSAEQQQQEQLPAAAGGALYLELGGCLERLQEVLLLLLAVAVAAPGYLMLLLLVVGVAVRPLLGQRLWVVVGRAVCLQGPRWRSGCSSCRLLALLVLGMRLLLQATHQVGAAFVGTAAVMHMHSHGKLNQKGYEAGKPQGVSFCRHKNKTCGKV